ncbi:12805_t:CDS:2, partial [Acaulospora morrowiae]
ILEQLVQDLLILTPAIVKLPVNIHGPNNTRTLFPKVHTVLQYDESWNVVAWGESALAREIDFWDDNEECADKVATTTLEYFKLHLAGSEEEKPYLPEGFDYRKAIKDFLKKMMELVKETLTKRWQELEMSQVRFVFTIPAQ